MNEQAFRNRARELAVTQLAPLFAELDGFGGHGQRFEIMATDRLLRQIAKTLAEFAEQAPVVPTEKELEELIAGGRNDPQCRKIYTDRQRARLEQAGLAVPKRE
jgi:hypothetical protein